MNSPRHFPWEIFFLNFWMSLFLNIFIFYFSTSLKLFQEDRLDLLNELKLLLNPDLSYESICISEFKKCRPFVESKSKMLNFKNHLIVDVKHCSCLIKFYECLKNWPSHKYHHRIGHIYFNILKAKCFHYDFRKKCSLHFLGRCFLNGDFGCHVNLIKMPIFK